MIENLVIIPYRNRKKHLDYFIKHTWPLMEKNVKNPFLLIVEQDDDNKLFNRGKLLNVGVDLYRDNTEFIITHDVDINPYKCFLNFYNKKLEKNTVYNIFGSPCKTLGGITKIKTSDMHELNGFTNEYYGWGCEDRSLYNRAIYFNKKIIHGIFSNDKVVNYYLHRFNDVNDRKKSSIFFSITDFEYNKFNKLSNKEKKEHIFKSGLNNINYTIKQRKCLGYNIEHIIVQI